MACSASWPHSSSLQPPNLDRPLSPASLPCHWRTSCCSRYQIWPCALPFQARNVIGPEGVAPLTASQARPSMAGLPEPTVR